MIVQRHIHVLLEKDYWICLGMFMLFCAVAMAALVAVISAIVYILHVVIPPENNETLSWEVALIAYAAITGWCFCCAPIAVLDCVGGRLFKLHWREVLLDDVAVWTIGGKPVRSERFEWLKDNCEDEYALCRERGAILFKSRNDVMLFKLTWG